MTDHIAYAHISAVPAIFCRYISVIYMSHVVLFAYVIKLSISTRSRVKKILAQKLYREFKFAIQSRKYLTKFRVIDNLNYSSVGHQTKVCNTVSQGRYCSQSIKNTGFFTSETI